GLAHKPTVFFGVPALYAILSLMKNAPLSSVKCFFSGGDALPDRIRAAFSLVYRRKLCGGYGLTETAPVVAVEMDDVLEATDTVGKPVIGVEVLIKDEQGITLPHGQVGEIWIKGENVMLGYYHAPELTKETLVDGWLRTGDLGYFDSKGKLVVSGRLKDLIIHKGLNIYPQEIENIIVTHPNVIFVGIVGKPDELSGEVPIAFVQIKEDESNIEQKLRELCIQKLAAYKVPRQFICSTKRLPVTAMGKVDKKVLKAQLHEQKTR
ncbi:long-chain fatty acid--CoA ligase, partial [Candidatus Dependentiae bacterium]